MEMNYAQGRLTGWRRWAGPPVAIVAIGYIFVGFFGDAVVGSVKVWPLRTLSISGGRPPANVDVIGGGVAVILLAGFCFCIGLWLSALLRQWKVRDAWDTMIAPRPPLAVVLGGIGVISLANVASSQWMEAIGGLAGFKPEPQPSTGHGPLDLISQWLSALGAGFLEEPLVVGLPALLLVVGLRWHPLLAIAVSVALRISFHLYYGPGAFGMVIWATVAVCVYVFSRTLIPLISAHVLWNTGATLNQLDLLTTTNFDAIVLGLGVLLVVYAMLRVETVSRWVNRNPFHRSLGPPIRSDGSQDRGTATTRGRVP